ncbi:hypothetical protein Poly30_09590 [Planctomycetes bacterium Poly30]|uniref:Glycosyltransferase RgtA/B/C/D-like domain-containing protein n=1 Tax=Saltatorellus ferox TaxID=2528018 RepID=A0A518EN15_9BACT|nr:hypothetical protein Poly30_09590 [Planctomycetes bacterium Poly30]
MVFGTGQTETGGIPQAEARFRRGLMGLVALGALGQFLIQSQAFGVNPMALVPQVDAATIWEQAGEIAGGTFVDDKPYDTAPLVLWVAGAVRALGGGLVAWGVLQSVLHLITAVLIALTTRSHAARAGAALAGSTGAGLLAGALFLLLDEPAASTSRVLSGTLQLFLASGLLYLLRPRGSGDESRLAGAGALIGLVLGLLCLAYPPMLAGIPFLGAWIYLASGRSARSALVMVGGAALAILPATLHNVKASGELIPISAQAGLTFYHGNNASADGTIAPVGVVNDKGEQALDSLRQARAQLGDSAGWKDASRYWMGQGLDWWAEHPGAGAKLALTKLWYAISGQRYGDVYQPWRERADGVASRLWLAPLPLAWLLPLALVGLFTLLRDRSTRMAVLPLFLLVVVPIAVVVVFFYTPRYRLPVAAAALPLVAVLVARLSAGRGSGQPARGAALAGVALLIGVSSGFVNRRVGFDLDPNASHEVRFLERMAAASGRIDRHGDGARYLEKIFQLDPESAENRGRLLDLLWYLAASTDPTVAEPAVSMEIVERLIAEFGPVPGLLDLRATAKAGMGDFRGALEDEDAALATLGPADPSRSEIEQRRALYAAGRKFELPSLEE